MASLYPRASCLGGCTAHNAMIFVAPPAQDWDDLAALTGDLSWSAAHMAGYLRRLEDCRHRWFRRLLAWIGLDRTGHGWSGWLRTEKALPRAALRDHDLVRVTLAAAEAVLGAPTRGRRWLRALLRNAGDPNDTRVIRTAPEGLFYTPLTTSRHRRTGARERVLATARAWPDLLEVRLHALATKVLFDTDGHATGVAFEEGARLYGAHAGMRQSAGNPMVVRARREVILAGGAFNTPQLLMLSGIGDAAALAAHGIAVQVDLPGVGRNLQDRYEIGVVNRMAFGTWPSLVGATFRRGDPQYRAWRAFRRGMYTSNGAGLTVAARSSSRQRVPDLFCMALLCRFAGYFPGYSRLLAESTDCLTWSVLKAHTQNRGGTVTLRSPDPREPPAVNFHYFEEGTDRTGDDLKAVVAGIRLARSMTARLAADGLIAEELEPGAGLTTDAELATYVRTHSWGHHACGSCAIGPRDAGGVVDPRFRVHGVKRLRIVDASVFPRIPGFFLASAVYMIGEKAADAILAG